MFLLTFLLSNLSISFVCSTPVQEQEERSAVLSEHEESLSDEDTQKRSIREHVTSFYQAHRKKLFFLAGLVGSFFIGYQLYKKKPPVSPVEEPVPVSPAEGLITSPPVISAEQEFIGRMIQKAGERLNALATLDTQLDSWVTQFNESLEQVIAVEEDVKNYLGENKFTSELGYLLITDIKELIQQSLSDSYKEIKDILRKFQDIDLYIYRATIILRL